MFQILFSIGVEDDLLAIPPYHRNRILNDMEEQLAHQPLVPTKKRKLLVNLLPPWEAASIVRELRSGDYRVFYDVDEANRKVYVRAVRKKPRGKTTKEII
ncbi:MAG: type II toxin-antitoxin system RelE/ParE family toxin [Nitrospirae bacterium]|nr:type II toxin-antitoxin system RelE/ParE family toxin [Nitrospirota bacterium]